MRARFWIAAVLLATGLLLVSSGSASAESWVETDAIDFLLGTAVNVTVAPSGDLLLRPNGTLVLRLGPTPVVPTGGAGDADSVRAYHASVVTEANGTFTMWYSGYDGASHRILRATSPDGITWTKTGVVIDSGNAPSVIREGAGYLMWYHSGGSIRHATSSDGDTWLDQGIALRSGAPGQWDQGWVHYPSVVHDLTGYWLYYAGWDGNRYIQIGLAHAMAPMGFVRVPGNPVLPVDIGAGAWDTEAVFAPAVLPGDPWRMFYVGRSLTVSNRIGIATSPDGLAWTRSAGNPVLSPSPSQGDFDSVELHSAFPLASPFGAGMLYYTGSNGPLEQIGLAALLDTYPSEGRFESAPFDSTIAEATWETLAWNATVLWGTDLEVSIRVGATSVLDASWSPWAAGTDPNGTALDLLGARYAQYAVRFTTGGFLTPVLHEVNVTYGPASPPPTPDGSTDLMWVLLLLLGVAIAVAAVTVAVLLLRARRRQSPPPPPPYAPPPGGSPGQ